MAGMLFACTKCHSRHPFEELSKEELLCKTCHRKYPLVACQYCENQFHLLKRAEGLPVCTTCAQAVSNYGLPKQCKYCQIKAAFKGSSCARCISSRKRYGEPHNCDNCKRKCAFNKVSDASGKFGGQMLCLRCMTQYKKLHQDQKLTRGDHGNQGDRGGGTHSNVNRTAGGTIDNNEYTQRDRLGNKLANMGDRNHGDKVVAPLKAESIAMTSSSRMDAVDKMGNRTNNTMSHSAMSHNTNHISKHHPSATESSSSHNDSKMESSFGDQLSELNKLRDNIARMKKIIAQKDKIILQKDKKINEHNAEKWDKDKLQKAKVTQMQKDLDEQLMRLRVENGDLRKQVSSLINKKEKYDARNASRIKLGAFKIQRTPGSPSTPDPSGNDSPAMENKYIIEPVKKAVENKDIIEPVKDLTDEYLGGEKFSEFFQDFQKDYVH